jgi:hypothetical protein
MLYIGSQMSLLRKQPFATGLLAGSILLSPIAILYSLSQERQKPGLVFDQGSVYATDQGALSISAWGAPSDPKNRNSETVLFPKQIFIDKTVPGTTQIWIDGLDGTSSTHYIQLGELRRLIYQKGKK